VRGKRSSYQPVHRFSRIVSSSKPLEIVDLLKPREVYVADLDRLTGSGSNLETLERISMRAATMADTGVSKLGDLLELPGSVRPVLGTETASLSLMEEAARNRKIIVSIDIWDRKVLTCDAGAYVNPLDLLRRLNRIPVEALIILELDRVGTSRGLDREFLEEATYISDHPLLLGGGIRGLKDLEALEELGFEGALVATAVHNGRIPLDRLR
jgi:phosphoribosylformimino-5-aminoimidazole carboxamide ribotide isomerase